MKIFTPILFFLYCSVLTVGLNPCTAQTDSSFRLLHSIKGNFSYLNVDNLDNIYLITASQQLKKINSKGDSLAVFNDVKRYGSPNYIDVSNPLKVLLYYPKFSTVVVLDRFLHVRNSINFRKQDMFIVNAITTAYDNNIWIFDEQNFSLKRVNDEGSSIQASIDWRNLFDTVPSPKRIMDRNNYVYLYDPLRGFYIFDYYGSFKNKLPFTGWDNVEITDNYIYGFFQNNLYSYQLKDNELKAFALPDYFTQYSTIKIMNGKLYLLKKDELQIYKIELNNP